MARQYVAVAICMMSATIGFRMKQGGARRGAVHGTDLQGTPPPTPLPVHAISLSSTDATTDSSTGVELEQKLGQSVKMDAAAPTREQCMERLTHFNRLDVSSGSKLGNNSVKDPDFLPDRRSIGYRGRLATSDTDYNKWLPMRDIAEDNGKAFVVIGQEGIDIRAIHQGLVGDCYLLAGLSGIAAARPDLIDAMFVRRDLWEHNIFTTKWFVDGKESYIEVDQMVPAAWGNYGTTFFAHPTDAGAWWPVILEKAFAKMYGSYDAIESGPPQAVFAAITGAFVSYVSFDSISEDQQWQLMVDSSERGYPMSTGTKADPDQVPYGLVNGHAYAVVKVQENTPFGKTVTIFNPWHSDRYNGKIPNPDKADGIIEMTWDELKDAMTGIIIAKTEYNYKVSSTGVYEGERMTEGETSFHIGSGAPFWVTLAWPGERMRKSDYDQGGGCMGAGYGDVQLSVTKRGSGRNIEGMVPPGQNMARSKVALVDSGAGEYVVSYKASWGPTAYIRDLHLSVYAPEQVFGAGKGDDDSWEGSDYYEEDCSETAPDLKGGNDGCCTPTNLCNVGEGDCDSDSQCKGALTCGNNNCAWGDGDDCCQGSDFSEGSDYYGEY